MQTHGVGGAFVLGCGILLGLCAMPLRADPGAALTLQGASDPIVLAPYVQVLRDEAGRWSIDDVRGPALATRFQPTPSANLSFGYTGAAFWYRATLRNDRAQPAAAIDRVLEVGFPTLDYVDFYVVRAEGISAIHAGDLRGPNSALLPYRTFAIPLRILPGDEITVYLRVANGGIHNVPINVWTDTGFRAHAGTENFQHGLINGILLVMALYNFIIWLWIRDRAYLYYVGYILAAAVVQLIFIGYARQYGNGLFAGAPVWINAAYPPLWCLGAVFGSLFAREIMQTRVHVPRIHRLTTGLIVLVACFLLLNLFVPYPLRMKLGNLSIALCGLAFIAISVHLSLQGVRPARFYLAASGAVLLAAVMTGLAIAGWLPSSFLTLDTIPIALCVDVTVLSLALADRINTLRQERFLAQTEAQAARERVDRLRAFLPQKVAELVVASQDNALLEPKRREVTVCVIDLRGFTPFTETATPEDVMAVLRDFYASMGAVVDRHGGTVEHFAGDSMLIFFNAPLEIDAPASQAVGTALEMRSAFEALRARWTTRGHELGMGIGVASGFATIGAIGFAGRSQYAAIGAVTNLAARLCSLARHGEILTTQRVASEVESTVHVESVGDQAIRGFTRPVQVMRLTGPKP